jgi:hypothetical protein
MEGIVRIVRIDTYIPVDKLKRTGRESTTPPYGTVIVWRCDEQLAHALDAAAKQYGLSRGMLIANTMRSVVHKIINGRIEEREDEWHTDPVGQ